MQDFIIRTIGITLLHSLWQAVLLAAIAGTLLLFTRRAGSALRYKLLCTLMLVFVAVVGYTFFNRVLAGIEASGTDNAPVTVYNSSTVSKQSAGLVSGSRISQWLNTSDYLFNRYASLLVLVWFVFFLVRFVRLLLGMVNADRLRYYKTNIVPDEWVQQFEELCKRLHIKQPVLLMESALLKVPVLIGYLKPVILIPAGMLIQLSAEQVEVILLHELAHVRRHDYLVNLLQNAIDTVFFFNPAILWISGLIRSERECCCDDMAILETKNKRQFVQALISFNEYSNTLETCSLSWVGAAKGQLLRRVQRIVTNRNSSLQSAELITLLAVTLLGSSAFIVLQQHHEHLPAKSIPITLQKAITGKHIIMAASDAGAPKQTHDPAAKPTAVAVPPATNVKKPIVNKKRATAIATMPLAVPVPVEYVPAPPARETEMEDESQDNGLAQFQRQLAALGYNENNAKRLRSLRDQGVSARFISSFLEAGYQNVSLDEFITLRNHGVQAAFTDELKKRGYGTVSLEQATRLVDHGVSIGFIEEFSRLGFTNISLEQAIVLRDHGVNAAFIESLKNKTSRLLALDDYIKLKDSGITRSP
jgi:beta-lactamase regulating signal transducer with metallopeptidase domain